MSKKSFKQTHRAPSAPASTFDAKDHDIKVRDTVTKGGWDAPKPHANGCVGCRRDQSCINCGKMTTLEDGRCLSGACTECCPKVHKHVDGDPKKIC